MINSTNVGNFDWPFFDGEKGLSWKDGIRLSVGTEFIGCASIRQYLLLMFGLLYR